MISPVWEKQEFGGLVLQNPRSGGGWKCGGGRQVQGGGGWGFFRNYGRRGIGLTHKSALNANDIGNKKAFQICSSLTMTAPEGCQ